MKGGRDRGEEKVGGGEIRIGSNRCVRREKDESMEYEAKKSM